MGPRPPKQILHAGPLDFRPVGGAGSRVAPTSTHQLSEGGTGDVSVAVLKASKSAEHLYPFPMCEGLTCSTEVTQPVGAAYMCFASACAMVVRTEWVNVQPCTLVT